jgi:predicted RNA-binding protein YlqC (UPF0109 family)
MKELVTFLVQSITGSKDFTVEERSEGDSVEIEIKAKSDILGIIIGKEGKTIKNLRKILAVKATPERKMVNISVSEA